MTPQTTTTTIQTCPNCPGVWWGFEFCPTCGGPLITATVTLEPVKDRTNLKRVRFDGGDGCEKVTQ